MAADQVEVMAALGFERFAVVGRDRCGRVGHRMALDHPDCVERLMVLNIVPTWKIFSQIDKQIATYYYHWFFLIQDFDFPERLIVADSEYYLRAKLGKFSTSANDFTPEPMRGICAAFPIRRQFTLVARTVARRPASTSSTTRRSDTSARMSGTRAVGRQGGDA